MIICKNNQFNQTAIKGVTDMLLGLLLQII